MQQKTLDLVNSRKTEIFELAKSIVSGQTSVSVLEMSVSLKENLNSPAIMSVFKDENIQIGFSVVKILVDRFVDSFGFSTKLSSSQTETLCIDTFDNFRGESLGDIILFFKMARNGLFGTTHRGIDSNLIFGDWFPQYLSKKAEEREKIYLIEKSKEKESLVSIEDIRKAYTKLQNNTFQDRVIAYVEKITTGINREQLEKLISEWESDEDRKKWVMLLKAKRTTIR